MGTYLQISQKCIDSQDLSLPSPSSARMRVFLWIIHVLVMHSRIHLLPLYSLFVLIAGPQGKVVLPGLQVADDVQCGNKEEKITTHSFLKFSLHVYRGICRNTTCKSKFWCIT